jgi:hypothetical protein
VRELPPMGVPRLTGTLARSAPEWRGAVRVGGRKSRQLWGTQGDSRSARECRSAVRAGGWTSRRAASVWVRAAGHFVSSVPPSTPEYPRVPLNTPGGVRRSILGGP